LNFIQHFAINVDDEQAYFIEIKENINYLFTLGDFSAAAMTKH